MADSNFRRMMEIIDGVFETRNDPDQLQVTEKDIAKLQALHPSTLSEYNEGNGPCIWVLLIPTTRAIMNQFLEGTISENGILQQTKPGTKFKTVYLCSATTLPEHRGKGLTSKLTIDAINSMRAENPVTDLFVWPFTKEGEVLARKIAESLNLPLHVRKHPAQP
jgi:hypothetical protein